MTELAIQVDNLGKRYRVGERLPYLTLRDSLARIYSKSLRGTPAPTLQSRAHQSNYIWALKDASFQIKRGDVVGVIGRNGAGKSTLLKILARVTKPTAGKAQIRGRMGSLLEVGTGFHRELTGRENTYMNGAILGMSRRDITRKFDEIVAFAEIERFIDTPVKYYSSGMYVRLAFSVAAHLEPEILLVDEVLAVGDVAFQRKCLGRMGDVAKQGRTVLFVSHNMSAIASLCKSAIVLEQGHIKMIGDSSHAVSEYLMRGIDRVTKIYQMEGVRRPDPSLLREVEFLALEFDQYPARLIPADSDISVLITVRGNQTICNFCFYLTVYLIDGTPVGSCSGTESHAIDAGEEAKYRLTLPNPRLAPGCYRLEFGVGTGNERNGYRQFDVTTQILDFEVMAPLGQDGTNSDWQTSWGTIRFRESVSTRCN